MSIVLRYCGISVVFQNKISDTKLIDVSTQTVEVKCLALS